MISGLNCIAQQEDHLEPVDSFFWKTSFYNRDSVVRSELANDFKYSPTIAILFIPTFSLPNAILFLDSGSKHLLISKGYVFKNKLSALVLHRSGVTIKTTTAVLDSNTWNKLTTLFLLALEKTKKSQSPGGGFDGKTTYFFSYKDPQKLSGKVWSPEKGTMMYELLAIKDEIIATYTKNKHDTKQEQRLMKRIDALMARMNSI